MKPTIEKNIWTIRFNHELDQRYKKSTLANLCQNAKITLDRPPIKNGYEQNT